MEKISPALLTVLFNAAWQVTLVALVASIAAGLLRSAPARFRHGLWVAAFFIAGTLPVVTSARSLRAKEQLSSATATVPAPLSTFAASESTYARPIETPAKKSSSLPMSLPRFPRELSVPSVLADAIFLLYCGFVLLSALSLMRAWWMARLLVRESVELHFPPSLQRVIANCLARTRVKGVRFLVSSKIAAPLTVGAAPAVVILPEKLLDESDESLLTSALGHELIHIARRDYVLNVVYRLLYIPLSFHPAAALIKRRIDETRELRCDELVTDRLLSPTAYARSLVQLAGDAHAFRRPATVAVGIADADILEVRIMSMLKKRSTSAARRALMLTAAALVLVVPCIAAAPYAMHAGISPVILPASQPTPIQPPLATQDSAPAPSSAVQQEQQQPENRELVNKKIAFVYAAQPDGWQAPQESEARMKRKAEADLLEREGRELSPEERAAREKLIVEKLAMRRKELAELSKAAKITMQQAIEAALRQQQGTVMESSLTGEKRFVTRQPDGTFTENSVGAPNPMYRVVIISGDENAPVRTIVLVSAIDGTILRTGVE